jgi:hypothetical protein
LATVARSHAGAIMSRLDGRLVSTRDLEELFAEAG